MPSNKTEIISRIASRAWRDEDFLTFLLADPRAAMVAEFGSVPDGFENVAFRPRPIDRVVSRTTPQGQRLLIRPQRGHRPVSVVTREILGIRELIIVLYTRRCRYQCSFCTLPSVSAHGDVPTDSIRAQLDAALEFAADQQQPIQQVSLGNEGSVLDERTFSCRDLEAALRRCSALPVVEEIVLETRAEFADDALLDELVELVSPRRLTLKIGLESVDHRIRERILRKKMDLTTFERVIASLGGRDIGLASYVLVKADPAHNDAEGRADALATCRYLRDLCKTSGTRLTLRVNAMYRAEGSPWASWARRQGWTPPSILDIAEVMYAARDDETAVFAGLSEEGLATFDGHFEARPDFEPWALAALEEYNRSGDLRILRRVATHRSGTVSQTGG